MSNIKIYGKLENATPEGILAGANQIKDDSFNKKQDEINSEFKRRIENLEGGSGGSGSGTKTIKFSELDTLSSLEVCGYYVVLNDDNVDSGSLIVTGDYLSHGVTQFLLSNFIINNSGQIDGRHKDELPTIITRYKLLSGSWSKWTYYPIDDSLSNTVRVYSSKKVQDELDKRYTTIGFAGILSSSVSVDSLSEVPDSGDKTTVFYHEGKKAFVIKKSSNYYTRWNNVNLWNDSKTNKASTSTYFISNEDNLQYTFDGSSLKLTSKSLDPLMEDPWYSVYFAEISEETPDLIQFKPDNATPTEVYYMKNHKVFAYKEGSSYYTTFANTIIWNVSNKEGTLTAKTKVYFIDINGIQYTFNGTDLRPTGNNSNGEGNGWNTSKFNSILDGSEDVSSGQYSPDEVSSDEIFFSEKYSTFLYKDSNGIFYTGWSGVENYNIDLSGSEIGYPLRKRAKEDTYFIDADQKQYTFEKGSGLIPTGSTNEEESQYPEILYSNLDDTITEGAYKVKRTDNATTYEFLIVTSNFSASTGMTYTQYYFQESGKLKYRAKTGSGSWNSWGDIGGASSGGTSINVVQTTGNSTSDVMSQKAVTDELNKKQDRLVSGTNIKTINNQSLLGSGSLSIPALKEITDSELDTTVSGGIYIVRGDSKILTMNISVSKLPDSSDVVVSQYLFENDGGVKRRTRKNADSWSSWEYQKQEAGDSDKFSMSQKAVTSLVGQLQVPVNFNSFISDEVHIEDTGSMEEGTKDNVFYYNYGTNHKFILKKLVTSGGIGAGNYKYYDQFGGQENWQADLNNPKTNTRFIDITGENYYYNGSELVSLGFADPIQYIYGKYDDPESFTEIAKKLLSANFFFAKIEVKISEGQYSQVFFNGKLINDNSQGSMPAVLVGTSVSGENYRMIGLGTDRVEIEKIVVS